MLYIFSTFLTPFPPLELESPLPRFPLIPPPPPPAAPPAPPPAPPPLPPAPPSPELAPRDHTLGGRSAVSDFQVLAEDGERRRTFSKRCK